MTLKDLLVDRDGRIFDGINNQIKAIPLGDPIPFFSYGHNYKSPEILETLEIGARDRNANAYCLSDERQIELPNGSENKTIVKIRAVQFFRIE